MMGVVLWGEEGVMSCVSIAGTERRFVECRNVRKTVEALGRKDEPLHRSTRSVEVPGYLARRHQLFK